jgi:NAD(P)-dependent dehydrogenase (short-subunit alcohol dehydrogenase family)
MGQLSSSKEYQAVANPLQNQTVVVIGGSSGIGAAVAARAKVAGARVIAISRSGVAPLDVEPIAADVLDLGAIDRAFASVGAIDHLVHTAGVRAASAPLSRLDVNALPFTFETKLFNAIHAVRLALPHMSERASITLTSGQVSRKFTAGSLLKGSVNAAVDAAGRHLAKELAPRRVNVVSPGIADTELWGEVGSSARADLLARLGTALPVGRIGTPEELAAAYLFVMTNGFVTGAVIDVDGGGLL